MPSDDEASAAALAPRITLVTRAGCHLCGPVRRTVAEVAAAEGVAWVELDVDTDLGPADARFAEYTDLVPVVLVDGQHHGHYRVDAERLRAALAGRRSWRAHRG